MKNAMLALVSLFLMTSCAAQLNRSLEDGKGGVLFVQGKTLSPGETAKDFAYASVLIDAGRGRRAQLEASAQMYLAYAPMYAGYMNAVYGGKGGKGGKDPRVDKLIDVWGRFSEAYAADQAKAQAAPPAPSAAPSAAAAAPEARGKKGKKGQPAQAASPSVVPPAPAIAAPGTDLKSGIAASKSFADLMAVFQRAAQDPNDPRRGQYEGVVTKLGSYANKPKEFENVRSQLAAAY